MTVIKQDDLIESVAAALQYISYYHPADYIQHLARAYEAEQSPAAKDAIAQILTNSRMCAEGKRPICQDTGIVNVFLKIGMNVRFEGFGSGSITDAVVDRVLDAAGEALEADVHADFEEDVDDAGVLADRPPALGAHPRVGEDLRDRVLRRRPLLELVGAREVRDVVGRVVVADVLQRGGDRIDEVGVADDGHEMVLSVCGRRPRGAAGRWEFY